MKISVIVYVLSKGKQKKTNLPVDTRRRITIRKLHFGAKDEKEINTMSENMKINEMNLEEVTGGHDGSERYGYTYGTVHDVVMYDSTACLTLRDAPDGNVIFTDAGRAVGWQNGDSIQVMPSSRTGNWIQAVKGGFYGWVNANYVWY